jgi:hypothetical protein
MQSEKYGQLIDKLAVKTDRREIKWKEGVLPNSFQASFPRQSIVLSRMSLCDPEEVAPEFRNRHEYIISIVNEFGTTVDEISNFDLEGKNARYWSIVEDLYKTARRQALDAEKVLDELLSELA